MKSSFPSLPSVALGAFRFARGFLHRRQQKKRRGFLGMKSSLPSLPSVALGGLSVRAGILPQKATKETKGLFGDEIFVPFVAFCSTRGPFGLHGDSSTEGNEGNEGAFWG